MDRSQRKTILPMFVILVAVFVANHHQHTGTEERVATPIASQTASGTSTALYRNTTYDFVLSYPQSATLRESPSVLPGNIDTWNIVEERIGKEESKDIDCPAHYPDELYLSMTIADVGVTSSLQTTASAIQKRYTDGLHTKEVHGGKTYRVQRNIPGMCANGTEAIWKAERENLFVVFTFPSDTTREEDYWKIIQSLTFNGNEDRTP